MGERDGGRHGRKEWVLGQRGKERGREEEVEERGEEGWSESVGG